MRFFFVGIMNTEQRTRGEHSAAEAKANNNKNKYR